MKIVFVAFLLLFSSCLANIVSFDIDFNTKVAPGLPIAKLGLGNPPQMFNFHIPLRYNDCDTQSLIVTQNANTRHAFFNETMSSSLKHTTQHWNGYCIPADKIEGTMDFDELDLGSGFTVDKFAFLGVSSTCESLDSYGFDGTLGMGRVRKWTSFPYFRQANIPLNLFHAGKIRKPYMMPVSASAKGDKIKLVIGDVTQKFSEGTIKWVKLNDTEVFEFEHIEAQMLESTFMAKKVRLNFNRQVIAGPPTALNKIYNLLGATVSKKNDNGISVATVDCSKISTFPPLVFHIDNQRDIDIVIRPTTYVIEKDGVCILDMVAWYGDYWATWELGYRAYQDNSIIFDYDIDNTRIAVPRNVGI